VKRLVVLVTGVAAVGLGVGMGASAAAPDEGDPSFQQLLGSAPDAVARHGDTDRRLAFVERNVAEVDIDNSPAGFSQGDEMTIASVLTKNGKSVGRFDGHVVFTYVNLETGRLRALLNATASLREGEVEVQGAAAFNADTAELGFAVVGGTGRYDDVGGEAHLVPEGDATKLVLDLEDLD
jgi:hypothetical protein